MLYAYAIGILLAGIINTIFGSVVFLKNKRAIPNIFFGLLSLVIAIWCYSWFAMLLVKNNENLALFFARLLNFGAVFIPIFYTHWILSVLGIDGKQKRNLLFGYILTFILSILSWTPYYVKNVHSILFFPYWPSAGFLYIWYLIFGYFVFAAYGVYLLLKNFRKADDIKKNQIKYVVLGSLMGFGAGAVNFFFMYNINPFGSYGNTGIFTSLGLFIPFTIPLAYATIRYQLMDIKIVFTEIMAGLVAITLFVDFVFSLLSGLTLITVFKAIVFLIFSYLGILLVRSVLREIKYREEIKRAYEVEKKALEIETRARKELEKLDIAKDQFTRLTQHNIRTPLTAMLGYLDLILGGSYGRVPVRVKEYLRRFMISSKRLNSMVTEFMDVSKFQLGKDVVTLVAGVRIEPLVKEVLEELEFLAKQKHISLKLEMPRDGLPTITADKERIKAALFNVIDNAVKYTNSGEVKITVATNSKFKIPNSIIISVKDNGIGIPKEKLPNIFKMDQERDETAKKINPGGRGIGMYLSAKIVEAHKGKIWAESEGIGKGSTFYVELPVG